MYLGTQSPQPLLLVSRSCLPFRFSSVVLNTPRERILHASVLVWPRGLHRAEGLQTPEALRDKWTS